MYKWVPYTLFFTLMLTVFGNTVFAAGDYILEEKFHKELVKAEKGDPKAQYAIGQMYEKGRGIDKDSRKAFSWYSKSSQKGYVKAEYKLGMAYISGKGIRKNSRKAYEWLKKSSDKGYVRAQYNLASLYEHGRGTEKNLDKALAWYKKALAGGYDVAAAGVQRVASQQEKQRKILAPPQSHELASASVSKKVKKVEKVEKVEKKKPAKIEKSETKAKPPTTQQRIQAGGWKKRNKAVEYLPSAVTRCTRKDDRLECLSSTLTRSIGIADIEYQTKATLYNFKADGTFKVTYRNKVTKVTVTDEESINSGMKVPVAVGWQDKKHSLTCVLNDEKNLRCTKNKLSSISLHR